VGHTKPDRLNAASATGVENVPTAREDISLCKKEYFRCEKAGKHRGKNISQSYLHSWQNPLSH
jgi:hypothetical protein